MPGEALVTSHQTSQHVSTLEALSHLKAQLGCKWVIFSYGVHGLIQPQCLGIWRVLVKDGAGSPVRYRYQQPSGPYLHSLELSLVLPLTDLGRAVQWLDEGKREGALSSSHTMAHIQEVSLQGS